MSGHLSIPVITFTPSTSPQTPSGAGRLDTRSQNDNKNQESYPLVQTPTPIYRHAAPSGPWPWMDFDEDVLKVTLPQKRSMGSDTESWCGYPQSLFPNWTESQVSRCKMLTECRAVESTIFKVDVLHNDEFSEGDLKMTTVGGGETIAAYWALLARPRNKSIRVRAIFVKNMTKEVLQMLGTNYHIEPFFFSSSTNWIPSRYQENLQKQSDHITVVLPFMRVMDASASPSRMPPREPGSSSQEKVEQVIDTQSPIYLDSCNQYILQDLLSVHMVRGVETSTIISYHPESRMATAEQLHRLIKRSGDSVYWSKIFHKSKDPTFLFLCFLWYAMYQWDEVFETLYAHVSNLEQLILDSKNIRETRHLHILQAHLLYYRTLLEDFRKSIVFVQETSNPALMDMERDESKKILKIEIDYLLSEVERLESQRSMQVMRLKNVIDLSFATVNIEDSKYMKDLTIVSVRDSVAMKQISYLAMIFLPGNFLANVFCMNIIEINPSGGETLAHYAEGAVSLTAFAAWAVIALQVESRFFPSGSTVWRRAGWPLFFVWDCWFWVYRQRFGFDRKEKAA